MKLGLASEDGGSTAQLVPLQIKSLFSDACTPSSEIVFHKACLGCWDPRAQPFLMPSCTFQSFVFIVSDTDPPPPQWLQRWQRAPVAQDKRQTFSPNIPLQLSDMPPCFPSAGQSDWHLPQHWWHDLVSGVGHEGSRKEKKALVLAQWRAVSREKSFLAVSLWSCFMSPQGAKANFSALLKRHY